MDWIVIGIIVPWILLAFGCWLGYQLVRQNGRILLRLEALEARLASGPPGSAPPAARPAPSGLAVGTPAPEFELPDLSGERRSLAQFRGKRVLLIFFNPRCGFCTQMAGDLAALPTDGEGPVPLVVSTGEAEANRSLVQEHGIHGPVLLQEQMEIASQYHAHGTPMGYLIDAQGRIASEIAVGAAALLELAGGRAAAGLNGNGQHAHRGNRDLTDSKIERSGLAAGTPAPNFTLPTLAGEELSLAEFRGRKVLLLFSDPKCGPCDQLMPELEQCHRRSGDLQVLMVSRGDVEANREKAQEHGLTFPILLQKQWEVSWAYAMFATPIAYLIDEEGVTAAGVAVGVDPIVALLASASAKRRTS